MTNEELVDEFERAAARWHKPGAPSRESREARAGLDNARAAILDKLNAADTLSAAVKEAITMLPE